MSDKQKIPSGHENVPPHRHPNQPDIEDRPLSYYQVMTEAVAELLIEKGMMTAEDLRKSLEDIDAKTPALGGKMVARAWDGPRVQGTNACRR